MRRGAGPKETSVNLLTRRQLALVRKRSGREYLK
jgi:hypothetical protein